jgi:hypothetical protein
MTEQQKILGDQVLIIASRVRRCVLEGEQEIKQAIDDSWSSEQKTMLLTELAEALMSGTSKENIINQLNLPDSIVERLDKYDIYDWEVRNNEL